MLELLAQTYTYTTTTTTADEGALAGFFALTGIFLFFVLAVLLIVVISMWKIFEKAGVEGQKAIIPVYNAWVLAELVGKPGWWGLVVTLAGLVTWLPIIGWAVAIASIVLQILISIELAKSFGKEPVWALLLIFVPVVGFPMLAFGDTKYIGPGGQAGVKPKTT